MIDENTLLSYKTFSSSVQIEKDYIQNIILKGLYEKASSAVVFKGGTALQKVYGLSRFSEDLDFTINADVLPEIDEGLENASKYCDIMTDISSERITIGSLTSFKLMINGPLSIQRVTVYIVNEHTSLDPIAVQIRPIYKDLQPYLVVAMDQREILAEKMRAILSRETKKARDLYDLHFMLKCNCL